MWACVCVHMRRYAFECTCHCAWLELRGQLSRAFPLLSSCGSMVELVCYMSHSFLYFVVLFLFLFLKKKVLPCSPSWLPPDDLRLQSLECCITGGCHSVWLYLLFSKWSQLTLAWQVLSSSRCSCSLWHALCLHGIMLSLLGCTTLVQPWLSGSLVKVWVKTVP